MNADVEYMDNFFCADCQKKGHVVTWHPKKNRSLQKFYLTNEHVDFKPYQKRGMYLEDQLLFDADGVEKYEVGSERHFEALLELYGPESNLPQVNIQFGHDEILTMEYLARNGWGTFNIGREKIQRPYFYKPGHAISQQIKAQTSFGPDDDIPKILSVIEDLAGVGLMLIYTDTQSQRVFPAELGDWITFFNAKNSKSERFSGSNINRRFNVISMEFSKERLPNIFMYGYIIIYFHGL